MWDNLHLYLDPFGTVQFGDRQDGDTGRGNIHGFSEQFNERLQECVHCHATTSLTNRLFVIKQKKGHLPPEDADRLFPHIGLGIVYRKLNEKGRQDGGTAETTWVKRKDQEQDEEGCPSCAPYAPPPTPRIHCFSLLVPSYLLLSSSPVSLAAECASAIAPSHSLPLDSCRVASFTRSVLAFAPRPSPASTHSLPVSACATVTGH